MCCGGGCAASHSIKIGRGSRELPVPKKSVLLRASSIASRAAAYLEWTVARFRTERLSPECPEVSDAPPNAETSFYV